MRKTYDVIIIGAGPAGIFASLELLAIAPSTSILMVEKGSNIYDRHCPLKEGADTCASCSDCAIVSGWGGAGAYSDGKLSLSPNVGGTLGAYIQNKQLTELIDYVDGIYQKFGAPSEIYGSDSVAIESIRQRAESCGLEFVPCKLRHIGTDRCLEVLKEMERELSGKVEVIYHSSASEVLVSGAGDERKVTGLRLESGDEYFAENIIMAPGREGSRWLEQTAHLLGLETLKNPVDIGVRVEVPSEVLEPLTSITYEPKIICKTRTFNDNVRTFCVNPYGVVVKEHLGGIWTVNGHSNVERSSVNTNFALLASATFTEPFDEPITYGRHIASLANFLGNGVIVQRLGDLRAGRRSNDKRIALGKVKPTLSDATAGDLSYVLPYRLMLDIIETLEAMDKLVPGLNSDDTLLYGLEVKFYSLRLSLNENLQTRINGLYAVGDGAGISRGLIQASVSGVIAARSIT